MLLRIALIGLTLTLTPAAIRAQGTEIAFGSLAHDSALPVEVTAEALRVDQASGSAVFDGDVLVGQGDMRLSADRVLVVYGTPEETTRRRIERLEASGNVLLTLAEEAAEGDEAVYSIDDAQIVMTGNVLLTQGNSAISGQRLVVDLDRGTATMAGRVRTVYQPTAGTE